ncbi:MAG TPA: lipopolysaccharide kinase InaA family protein [Tepidisphaeraceae bacterium]|nr:lipopolysaccharide kinase InaA family protein [Tepidisphaeraceae bacterium]
MSSVDLENTLRDLPRLGTLVKDRGYRQVWRFVHNDRAYYLKFYPKGGPRDRFRRFFRGSPALREFSRLQALQKANIPAPRAVAALMGFAINDRRGDAVVLEAIEPSIQLDQLLSNLELRGEPIPDHLYLASQIRALVQQLAKGKLGHEDLHLGNLLLHQNNLYLLDGYAVRSGGLQLRDLLMLGHSVRRYATLTDLQRGWDTLGPGGRMPLRNPHSDFLWKRFLQGITKENRYFGRLNIDGWTGVYYKHTKYPHRWSAASKLEVTAADWQREWPLLLQRIESDQLEVIKRSRSGEVFAGEIVLNGRPLQVIVKRPRRRYWYRYINEIGRGSRPRRAWRKAWNLLVRGLPTAWPLLVMERRSLGYVTDAIFICERVPGATLAHADLDALPDEKRDRLFHRTGKILREIERLGFSHFDAKASNWIVFEDDRLGPTPVLIDIDGIRRRRWIALGIRRLLKSMHENPHYAPIDSLALCRGYAPYAAMDASSVIAAGDSQREPSQAKAV